MSWFPEIIRHRRRISYHRKRGTFNPPRPLDCVVLAHKNAPALDLFLETLTARTQWPLRIWLCATEATDAQTGELLARWEKRHAAPHEISIKLHAAAEYPDAFNAALEDISNDVFVLSEGRVIVPDLGKICWATTLLQLMFDFPHVGWLNASLNLAPLADLPPSRRKAVRSTRRTILRDTPDTQLALVRRDCFDAESPNPLHLDGIIQEKLSKVYCAGRAHSVTASPIWSCSSDVNSASSAPPRFYVITRTHARRASFEKCRSSVERQTCFADIVHIVTYEDDADLAYIPEQCVRVRVRPAPEVACWYETYMNDALRHATEPGFVLFLDDDDYIVNSRLVETLLKKHALCDAVFFRTRLNDKRIIPAALPFASPPYGDIASCGYASRTEFAARAAWTAGHAGDYRYISALFRLELAHRRIAWCSQVLTSTQNGRHEGAGDIACRSTLSFHDEPILIYAADSNAQYHSI